MRLILADRQAEYFSLQIWTGVIELKARRNLVFRRRRFRDRNRLRDSKRDGDRTHSRPTGKSRHTAGIGA
jgi:hypothetical protein